MKKSGKVLCNPYSASAFFGDRFLEKDGGLRTHNPSAKEVRGLEVFCIKGTQA
jgi:hypothetical protein